VSPPDVKTPGAGRRSGVGTYDSKTGNAKSTTLRRCPACLTHTPMRPWYRVCWRCHRYHLFGTALAQLRAASDGLGVRA
jgi:hypothetical protein